VAQKGKTRTKTGRNTRKKRQTAKLEYPKKVLKVSDLGKRRAQPNVTLLK
jgi:hypothetical protein